MRNKLYLFIVFFCISIAASFFIFAEDDFRTEAFYYRYNEQLDKFDFHEIYKKTNTYEDKKAVIETVMKKIETRYDIKIDIDYLNTDDDKGNTLSGCMVDIHIEKLSDLFSGQAHSSYIIEEVCSNILQPLTRNWQFRYLVLKINGVYADVIDYDFHYPSVMTAELFLDEGNYNWETYPDCLKK